VNDAQDRRLARLRAALGFLQLPPRAPELRLLHRWLDTWSGLGLIVAGMTRQGFQLGLDQRTGQWVYPSLRREFGGGQRPTVLVVGTAFEYLLHRLRQIKARCFNRGGYVIKMWRVNFAIVIRTGMREIDIWL
jgi:hypothetical protein